LWVCGFSYAYEFLFKPLITGFFGVPMPGIETEALSSLLFGMLGLVAARTVEKINGVAKL
jgi:hypothetical protein